MSELDAQFFRHEYGRLVAMLSRRVGVRHVELVEDAVQNALATAVETWRQSSRPENPSAWLFRVALNQLLSELRGRARRERLVERHESLAEESFADTPDAFLAADVRDDLLRMLFACCDDAIALESQLVLALKVLCGFDVREISERLFANEAAVYKRLTRGRNRLREVEVEHAELTPAQLASRLPAVQSVLYVLFTEGYLSSHAEGAIRLELCEEAIRLAQELAQHPIGATTETFALLALMHLHRARMPSRQDGSGGLVLLEEQDRSLWSQSEIHDGLTWLARSAAGGTFSRYHAEAGIAAEHCLAPSFAATRWDRIVECYELLDKVAPSALHTLNRAVALAEWRGPHAGLALLDGLAPPSWLSGSYLWSAVLADLHRRANNQELAKQYRIVALGTAPSAAVRAALDRRLQQE
ncbi:MAG: RNA polymerase sigma factor [Myxococcota bacterium]